MLGQERGPLLGKPFAAWLADVQTRGAFFPYLSKVLSSGDRVTTELLLSSKANTSFWVRLESVVTGESGQCLTMMIDITEHKQAEQEVREKQQLLAHIIENIPHSIFWKDKNSVYLGCNRNFAEEAGLQDPENIVGKTDYDLAWKEQEADFFRKMR